MATWIFCSILTPGMRPRIDVWLQGGTGPVRSWQPKVAASVKVLPLAEPVGMELWTYRQELNKDLPGHARHAAQVRLPRY